ncbi:hypothetical protein Afil01_18370 [Actinorhabdospora filicis]|uniref:Uncharacterized protein n=2 Tax=Actinorhabdospora filicis TaxID=1785913 RepID=A0A9W6W9W4_9ACTN|nr:hypothetical protein Afil01_18370 [Actinorhabdospora filicis]
MHDSTEHVDLVDLARAAIRESRRAALRRAVLIVLGALALLLAAYAAWTLLSVTVVSTRTGCVHIGRARFAYTARHSATGPVSPRFLPVTP